jgi:serine protease AprX
MVGAMSGTRRAASAARGKSWQRRAVPAVVGALTVLAAVAPSGALAATTGGGVGGGVPLSPAPSGAFNPATDMGSLYNVSRIIRADAAWQAGYTGKGVDIALIDSGVSPVAGLTSGNVINGPDLSFDSQKPSLTSLDGYGHGTHMAGIIVGRDAASSTPAGYATAAASRFTGIAPDARLISVKAGAFDGSVDVTQVIAGINWVTQHAHDPGFNIRVISLSYGTDSTQPSQVDPLAYAVEAAWKAGIVVVASGGNDGTPATVLANPGYDPYVVAVGADDPQGTLDVADDTVPDFASRGTNNRHVDLVAPGAHVAGLVVPGSVVASANPSAIVGSRFIRGSGTSQATAVVAGAAALVMQKYPNATPDQVKRQLMASARSFVGTTNIFRGNGVVDVYGSLTNPLTSSAQPTSAYGTGTGSVDLSRGTHVVSDGVADLRGEQDVLASAWRPAVWGPAVTQGTSWSGGTWNSRTWAGSSWTGKSWAGSTWANATWTGADWSGKSWADSSWAGKSWASGSWSSGTWAGKSWAGKSWAGKSWADAVWN